jgi:hypothetical protein
MLEYAIIVRNAQRDHVLHLVRQYMPTKDDLLARAASAGLPAADRETKLDEFIGRYANLTIDGAPLKIDSDGRHVKISQPPALGHSKVIDDGMRKILKRHLLRKFRMAGFACDATIL